MTVDKPHDYYHDPVLTYVDAAIRTSTRSREILILIIIASVLIFGSFWNSRQESWLNERISAHARAREFIKKRDKLISSKNAELISQGIAALKAEYPDEYKFLENRPELGDAKAVENALLRLQAVKTEHVLYLKLPFFGIIIDINDLGMLGGFTFVVLLLWFRSSLWHEANNLETTLNVALQQADRKYYYDALSMQQVLTTPPVLDATSGRDDHWSGVVKILMALPVLVQIAVVWNDVKSFQLGFTVSKPNTIIVVVISGLFWFGIAWLTWQCFKLLKRIALSWTKFAAKVRAPAGEEATDSTGQDLTRGDTL